MSLTVEVGFTELALRHRWTISRATLTSKRVAIVRLSWNGLAGWGEGAPISRFGETADGVPAAVAGMAPLLGDDPRRYRAILDRLFREVPGAYGAKAALDMALHDLAAKALGAPLYRVLGLDPAAMAPTSFSIGIDEPDKVAAKVREAPAFATYKIKLGTPRDREIVDAVRSATDRPLRVDANEAWKDRDEALAKIRWLAERGVELVEQPMPADDVEGARWLCARSPLPIIADEAVQLAADVPRLAGAYHGLNLKLQKCGGIAEALRVIEVARACGLKTMLGCMIESGLGIAAAAHIAPLVDWVDLDGNLLLAADPFPGHPVEGGVLRLRDEPGLGVAPAGDLALRLEPTS